MELAQNDRPLSPRKRVITAALLFVVAAAAYARTLPFGFVWDDHQLIEANAQVRGDTAWSRLWRTHLFEGAQPGSTGSFYRPLLISSYRLNWQVSPTPLSFHLTNVLIHGLVVVLALLAALRLGAAWAPALWAALLFALWAGHSEPVSWVSGRADLLLGLGIAIAVFPLLDRSATGLRLGGYVSLAAGVLIGSLCKEPALAVSALLLPAAALIGQSRGGRREAVRIATAVVVPLAIAVALRINALGATSAWIEQLGDQSLGGRLARLGLQIKLLSGFDLRALVDVPTQGLTRTVSQAIGVTGAFALMASAAMAWRRNRRAIALLLTIALLALLLTTTARLPALRYAYLPLWTLAVAGALGLTALARRIKPLVLHTVCALIVLTWGAMGQARLGAWRSDTILFALEAAQNPTNPDARFFYALSVLKRGRAEQAAMLLQAITTEHPEHRPAWLTLTRALLTAGDPIRAEQAIRVSLRGHPRTSPQYELLGHTLLAQDRHDEALAAFGQALALTPHAIGALRGALTAARALDRQDVAADLEKRLRRRAHPASSL